VAAIHSKKGPVVVRYTGNLVFGDGTFAAAAEDGAYRHLAVVGYSVADAINESRGCIGV
jgi:hypothetical protein